MTYISVLHLPLLHHEGRIVPDPRGLLVQRPQRGAQFGGAELQARDHGLCCGHGVRTRGTEEAGFPG